MPSVYILQLSNGRYYIGSAKLLEKRIQEHSSGKSKYTSHLLPVKLIFSQNYFTLKEARRAE